MRRFLSAGWLLRHVIAITLVVAFLWLGWWQAQRAGAGNISSYAYAVEWPVFAGFVIFMWVREVRTALRGPVAEAAPNDLDPTPEPVAPPPVPDTVRVGASGAGGASGADAAEDDDELAAYNRMLAWLNAHPGRRFTDYPG